MFENEYIQTNSATIAIPYEFGVSQIKSLVQEYNLTQEYKYTILSETKLILSVKSKNNDIYIVQIENDKLTILFKIKNYLSNNKLLIQPKNQSIQLNQQNCISLYKINQESWILICKMQENMIIIQILILNEQSNEQTIKDLTVVVYNPLCQIGSTFMYSWILLFEKDCLHSKFITYFIDENNYEIVNQTSFNIDNYNQSNDYIISVDICSPTLFRIYSKYYVLVLLLYNPEKVLFELTHVNNNQYLFEDSCTSSQWASLFQFLNNQLIFNQNLIIMTSIEDFIKGFLVNDIMIFQKKDHVIVYYNSDLQIIIREQFQQMISLSQFPYMLGITKTGQFLLYKISVPRFSFTYQNSTQIKLFQYQKRSKYFQQIIDSMIFNISIISEKSPKMHIQKNQVLFKLFNQSKIILFSSKLDNSLPLQLKQIQINQKIINFYEEIQQFGCQIDINNLQQFFVFELEKDEYLLFDIQNDTTQLIVSLCSNNRLQYIKKIKIQQKIIKIITFESPFFCLVYKNLIRIFHFENMNLYEQSYHFNHNIINAHIQEQTYIICFLFEDCNKQCYHYNANLSSSLNQMGDKEFKCIGNKQFYNEQLFVGEHELFWKNKVTYQEQIILQETINQVEITHSQIVLFTTNEEKQQIKLLSFKNNQLQFLYDCPLYGFNLRNPLNYRLLFNILVILAENDLHSPVLLVYNIYNSAFNSLIQVIELDQHYIHFDFIHGNRNVIYYIYQNFIQIRELNVFKYILEKQVLQINAFNSIDCVFTFESPISNETFDINQSNIYFNDNYQIRLIQNDTLNLKDNNVLDISNIFSNIISIEVIQKNDYQVIPPILFSTETMICQFYSNNCCITENEILCYLNNEKFISQNHYQIYNLITILCNENDQECTVMHKLSQAIFIMIVNFKNGQQSNEKVEIIEKIRKEISYHSEYQLDIKFYNNDIFIFYSEIFSKLYFFIRFQIVYDLNLFESNLISAQLSVRQIQDNKYIFFYQKLHKILYSIIKINNDNQQQETIYEYIIQDQICIEMQDLKKNLNIVDLDFYFNFKAIEIISKKYNNDILMIELLVLFDKYIGLILQLKIDIIKQHQCSYDVLQIIRYPINTNINKLLYVNNEFIILSVKQFENNSLILYDRFKGENVSLIHSIYILPDNNYIKIDKFNNSHFTFIKPENNITNVLFTSISQYKLKCLNQDKSIATLIINNEVSTITINVQTNSNIDLLLNYNIRFIIIIINFLLIQFFILLRNKKNNQNVLKK